MLIVYFLFQNKQYSERPIFNIAKNSPENFAFFEKKKDTIKINCCLQIAELFTLRLSSYSVFFEKKRIGG
jgi:hypothetical protein